MIINLSKIDFGGVATGGKSKPEEVFDVQPTTAEQTITPSEGSVFSGGTVRAVTSEIDNNIQPENIKEGVAILGVEGTLKEVKPEESFNVQPTTSEQTITPTEGSVFSRGTVHAVTSSIDSNIQPENIKKGVPILGVVGTLSAGGGSDVFVVPNGVKFGQSTFTKVPSNLDFSNVTDMSNMFYSCKSLTSVPPINTSKATNAEFMFYNCSKITTVSPLDLSSVLNAKYLFYNCKYLTDVPSLDLSGAIDVSFLFSSCSLLNTVPPINTSKATNVKSVFGDCTRLETVEGIDFSGLTEEAKQLFGYTGDMPNLTRFIVNGKINVSISDNSSIKALKSIDYESVKSILTAAANTDNTNAKTLAFDRTMTDRNGELAALVTQCAAKGWTISGLTLQ